MTPSLTVCKLLASVSLHFLIYKPELVDSCEKDKMFTNTLCLLWSRHYLIESSPQCNDEGSMIVPSLLRETLDSDYVQEVKSKLPTLALSDPRTKTIDHCTILPLHPH